MNSNYCNSQPDFSSNIELNVKLYNNYAFTSTIMLLISESIGIIVRNYLEKFTALPMYMLVYASVMKIT